MNENFVAHNNFFFNTILLSTGSQCRCVNMGIIGSLFFVFNITWIISIASYLVLGGGGGGARPPNVPTTKFTYMKLICTSKHLRNIFLMSQNPCYICIHYIQSMRSSLLLLTAWRYKQQYIDKTLTLQKSMYIYASERSEWA